MRPVIYQLFVRHFSNYCESTREWGTREENGCGTFEGITDTALEKIRDLGMTHIWLTGALRHATQTSYPCAPANPEAIVKGIAGSPYAVTDYYDVDPDLAVNPENRMEEFKALIARCRKAGLVPLIDFIPNHVSRDYKSRYEKAETFGSRDKTDLFFERDNSFFYLTPDAPGGGPPLKLPVDGYERENDIGRVTGNNCVTWSPTENDWFETIKLNYGFDFTLGPQAVEHLPGIDACADDVPCTWRAMDHIISYWQEMGVGGFRCDMAHMLPMTFWCWSINRARTRDEEVLFMAEAYDDHMKTTQEDPLPLLLEAGFDYVYDAPTYHLAHKIYEEGKWANDFDALCSNDDPVFCQAVHYVENHDEPRLASPLHWGGHGKKISPAISTLLYCLSPGAVILYNGQEVGEAAEGPGGYGGDNGRTSIFDYTHLPVLSRWTNKGKFDGAHLSGEEQALREHYRTLCPLLQHPALAQGKFYGLNWVNRDNVDFGRISYEHASGHWLYAFLRHDFESGKTVLCVVNLHPEWNFSHIKVRIPRHAFKWMGWTSNYANFQELGSSSPLTSPYLLEELEDTGFLVSLSCGQGMLFEITD